MSGTLVLMGMAASFVFGGAITWLACQRLARAEEPQLPLTIDMPDDGIVSPTGKDAGPHDRDASWWASRGAR